MKPERHVGYIYFAALRLDELLATRPGPLAQALTFRAFGA